MKKFLCIIISCIVLLYAVSVGVTMKLLTEAKETEFYDSTYFMPAQHETDIAKLYTDGEITFDDLSNAMVENDMRGIRLPYTCYSRFMDSAGTFISEAKCILKLQIVNKSPFKLTNKYIDIDRYMTEDFKTRYAQGFCCIVNSVELCRENNEFTPVALNVTWLDSDEDTDERVILSDKQTNINCVNNFGTLSCEINGVEYTAEISDNALYVEKNDTYNYFKAMADGYSDAAGEGTITSGGLVGNGRLEGNPFITYSYSVLNVSVGPYTYYTFSAVGVNLLEAVFDEPDYVKLLVAITAIFVLIGAASCGGTVFLFKKEYDE